MSLWTWTSELNVPVTRATLPERSKSDSLLRLYVLAMMIVNFSSLLTIVVKMMEIKKIDISVSIIDILLFNSCAANTSSYRIAGKYGYLGVSGDMRCSDYILELVRLRLYYVPAGEIAPGQLQWLISVCKCRCIQSAWERWALCVVAATNAWQKIGDGFILQRLSD